MKKPPDLIASSHTIPDADALLTVLNSLDALVYVADMDTHELIFVNDYALKKWGDPGERKCWQYLQSNQDRPCQFCTNDQLITTTGDAAEPYVWEFRNTKTGRWFQCRDQAVRWTDGRLVRIEVATDITDRKHIEEQLQQARHKAESLADTDALTGLNNRRAFFRLGNQALKEAVRFQRPLAMIMFDLDWFKHINDQWGHAIGDQMLQTVADVTSDTIREADILARLGGEEFAVLLPQTDLQQAITLAERMRNAISRQLLHHDEQIISCSASFGVTSCSHCDGNSLSSLLNQADQRLYQAKSQGRNQVAHD